MSSSQTVKAIGRSSAGKGRQSWSLIVFVIRGSAPPRRTTFEPLHSQEGVLTSARTNPLEAATQFLRARVTWKKAIGQNSSQSKNQKARLAEAKMPKKLGGLVSTIKAERVPRRSV